MIGRRIDPPFAAEGGLIGEWPQPGDFWFDARQGWMGVAPDGAMAGLRNHNVVEHDDGTITVQPSILVGDGTTSWHGYLERGVWRTA